MGGVDERPAFSELALSVAGTARPEPPGRSACPAVSGCGCATGRIKGPGVRAGGAV